jgi:MFS family permease
MSKQEKFTYFAFLWHGFFLAITMAMLDLNTVFPTLVKTLTESKYIFGALYSIMLGAPLIFNVIFSHFLRRYDYKRKYLLIGIYVRGLSFLGMAIFTYFFALSNPSLVIGLFFLFVFLFSVSSGFAGLSYSDIIAKVIRREYRTTFYTMKQFIGSTASFLGGLIIARIFTLNIDFPINYTISLTIGFVGLFIASLMFWFIKEPKSDVSKESTSLLAYIKDIPKILSKDKSFRGYIVVENLSSFSIMILPFYIYFAMEVLGADESYIGTFLIFQIIGTVFSNVLWGLIGKKFNAKTVVTTCIILGGLNPLVALYLSNFDPIYFSIVFFILGFTISGRRVGFEPYLLDIAPNDQRIEYLGIRGSLNIFLVVLPLLGASLIDLIGYQITFVIVSVVMFIAVVLLRRIKNEAYIEYCK